MELDQDEYGRPLRDAKESHISVPASILDFVIKYKFFESVKSNNKHASAIYAILYMALEIDITEALHFLLIHTSTEFDRMCNGITSSAIRTSSLEQGHQNQQEQPQTDDSTGASVVSASDSSGSDMVIINTLSKLFEAVTRMMNDYAYVESFGLKRNLLIMRCIQPVLEKHALGLMNAWLKISKFDEYALTIPSNDWTLYENYQLSKLESSESTADPTTTSNTGSPSPNLEPNVPSVRVGGKLDHTKVVLCLEQFSALSQLIETYKAYIRRTYEMGVEEMMEKGHSFVDLGESPSDGLPHISTQEQTVHNIRAYVSEPVQLFSFPERKSESYKQLESWFLGSALLAAYATTASSTSASSQLKQSAHSEGSEDPSSHSQSTQSSATDAGVPLDSSSLSPAKVFSSQKIDQVFSLVKRSLERAYATKQHGISLTLTRRVVALFPSFILSLFLRRIKSSLPKVQVETNYDITSKIFDFHGEALDIKQQPQLQQQQAIAKSAPSTSHHPQTASSSSSPSSSSSTSSFSSSAWYTGLGGLMSFVGTNASSAVSTAAAGVIGAGSGNFGILDIMLSSPPSDSVWIGFDLASICASLNDLSLCPTYFSKLQDELEKTIRYFDKSQAHRTLIFGILSHFKRSFPELFSVASYIQHFTLSLVPGLAYYLHQFWRTSYEIGEQEFRALELNDPWMDAMRAWLKSNLEPIKPVLQPQVLELCVSQLAAIIASNIERLLLRKKLTAFGALAIDSHLRSLITSLNSLLPQPSSFSVRHKFTVLKEVMTIICLESENEMLELWNAAHDDHSQFFDPSMEAHTAPAAKQVTVKWHLNAAQAKAYMKCRKEWKPQLIDSLNLV